MPNGATSAFHFWSFQESGESSLSPETCNKLGLPIELEFNSLDFSYCWTTDRYQLIREYQLLRDFDPDTIEFARHVGTDYYIFTSINDSSRFENVYEGCFTADTNSASTRTTVDSGRLLDIRPEHENERVRASETSSFSGDIDFVPVNAAVNYEHTTSDYIVNKRRRTVAGEGGIKNHDIHTEQVLCHKNDTTSGRQTIIIKELNVRPICPLPGRNTAVAEFGS
ncbi:hypothetical protein PM082_007006 [Marasmius tenuissimus]|nr:hypothetical protein PM082_007006 [Marasmius tenuissimus]